MSESGNPRIAATPTLRSWFPARRRATNRTRRRHQALSCGAFFQQLEPRELLTSFSIASSTLTLNLDQANQKVTITSESSGTGYKFVLSGGATNTWTGTSITGLVATGPTLTASNLALFSGVNITDSAGGVSAYFGAGAATTYSDNFNITLDNGANTAGAVAVDANVTASFTGSSALSITADGPVKLNSGATLSLASGNLGITVNTPAGGPFSDSGLTVSNATLQTTGTGLTTITANGGIGAAASFQNKGVAVLSGGKIIGGTTGTMTITGRGYDGVDGTAQGQGVFVYQGSGNTSTISSNGANVSVIGYGANSTNTTLSNTACMVNAGVVVGGPGTSGGTQGGLITSGGSGAVTVTGYGGSLANQSSSINAYSMGVYLSGSNATIRSGGAGTVTVNGTGGGAQANTACGMGVSVAQGSITSGTDGSVSVTGMGCSTARSSYNWGVLVQGATGTIAAGTGTGTTTVVGTGGGCGTATSNDGVCVTSSGTITSMGSGSVTVTGTGGSASGNTNRGVTLNASGRISSNGGGVLVTGTGGGSGSSANNYGVGTNAGGTITAGGTGNVTVRGYGGNNNGTGSSNHGVSMDSGGSGQAPGMITSGGGNVDVSGTGGGGTADSPTASASATNVGVYANQGGIITAGGTGTVTVFGQGGGRSPGATGATNAGVCISSANTTSANTAGFSTISSSGGAVSITGIGGGGAAGSGGTSGSNYGVAVISGGLITTGGNASLTINGTGGGFGTGASGSNHGVFANDTQLISSNSTYVRSTITTGGTGNPSITGTGGGAAGTGGSNTGILLGAGALITAGGAASTVTLFGQGGAASGGSNFGVNLTGGNATVGNTTVTSGGGNVTVTGCGPLSTGGTNQHGVAVLSNAILSSGGTGSVTVNGTGGTGDVGTVGNGHLGVQVSAGTIQSGGNGPVLVTGRGGGSGARTDNYGVQVISAGVITGGTGAPVTVRAYGGNADGSGGSNYGVCLTGSGSKITSSNGTLQVTGTGGQSNTTVSSSGSNNHGIYLQLAGEIAATGTASLTVNGTGGGLGPGVRSNNRGVYLLNDYLGAAPRISSEGGAVLVTGTGGGTGGTGTTNYGVAVIQGGLVTNLGNGGTVTVRGTGGGSAANATANNTGIYLGGCTTLSNYTITANNGSIALNGVEGTGSASRGIGSCSTLAGVIGNATTAGNITISADSVALPVTAGSAVNAAGQLAIAPLTAGVGVDLGSSTDTRGGPLSISGAELSTLTAGTIQLGGTASGNATISAAVTVPSGSNLTLASKGTGTTLIPTALATGLTYTAGKTLDVSALPAVDLTIAGTSVGTGYTQLKVNGDLSIAGKALNLSGSYVPTGGDVFTIVSASNLTGTFSGLADGSTVSFNGRTLLINYTASSVTLTDPSPLITGQPATTTVLAGNTATFTAAASGTPSPSVQWQVNTGSGWSNVSGATSGTYSFTTAAGDDGKQYRAVFTNTYGTATTTSAALTVNFAPSVSTQPTSQTAAVSGTATFTAAASGNPTPSVQWQVYTGTGWIDVLGATSTSYTTGSLSLSDSGTQYRAVFSNGIGTAATSGAATLTVTEPPAITSQPSNQTVAPGAAATFTAAASGTPTPTVQWQVNSGSGWSNIVGATATTYSLTTVAGDTGKQYRAVFTNLGGTATSDPATLTIQSAPVITTQPVGGTYLPGATTVLTVAATGTPAPTVQWQFRSGAGWSDLIGSTETSLTVAVSPGLSRQYRAVFRNVAGTSISDAATVQAAASVTGQIRAVRSGLVLNRTTGLYDGTITLTNTGSSALAAFSMLLSGLTAGVTLTNASGTLADGTAYLNAGALAAGQSITLKLGFRKPLASTSVNYTSQFYLKP